MPLHPASTALLGTPVLRGFELPLQGRVAARAHLLRHLVRAPLVIGGRRRAQGRDLAVAARLVRGAAGPNEATNHERRNSP